MPCRKRDLAKKTEAVINLKVKGTVMHDVEYRHRSSQAYEYE
jgi:hypothetical protein